MCTDDNIELRLKKIKNLYYKMDEIMDSLPECIPEKIKSTIKNAIFGDKELKELMEGLDKYRAPRFMMVGRTGVGKSSLVNAICGKYLAEVSDVEIGTKDFQRFEYRDKGRTLLEVLDTRGIGESLINAVEGESDAETVLLDEISNFIPDAIIFLIRCKSRDRIDEDLKELKQITRKYYKRNSIEIPIVVILNQSDEMEPSQFKKPDDYTVRKKQNIIKAIEQIKKILKEQQIKVNDIIAVSSLIDWGRSEEEIKDMIPSEKDLLEIEFDGRYNIDKLIQVLEKNVDVEARVGLLMAARLEQVVERLSKKITHIFAGISATVAITPIPFSDIYILTTIQCLLVMFISVLSGRDMSIKSAKEFLISLGGVGAGGLVFRTAAQQLSKLVNIVFPGAGSGVSSIIASSGTEIIGNAAVNYYIKDVDIKEVKKDLKKSLKKEINE